MDADGPDELPGSELDLVGLPLPGAYDGAELATPARRAGERLGARDDYTVTTYGTDPLTVEVRRDEHHTGLDRLVMFPYETAFRFSISPESSYQGLVAQPVGGAWHPGRAAKDAVAEYGELLREELGEAALADPDAAEV